MTTWNYDGTEQRNLAPMLKVTAIIAVPPQSHYYSLGAWQSALTTGCKALWDPVIAIGNLSRAPPSENKSRTPWGKLQVIASCWENSLWLFGAAWKRSILRSNRILACSVFSMGHLQPSPRSQREFCGLWELDANALCQNSAWISG